MKPLNETIGKIFKDAGIDLQKVREAAKRLAEERPELEQQFREQAKSKAFQDLVDNIYEDIEDMLDHEETPSDSEK